MRLWAEAGKYAIDIGRLNMVSGEPIGIWIGKAIIPEGGRFAPRFKELFLWVIPGTGVRPKSPVVVE